jgi:AraC-like DNA-binding protein
MILQHGRTILHIWDASDAEEGHMDGSYQPREREEEWVEANRKELVARLGQAVRRDGRIYPLPGLMLRRESAPTEMGHGMSYLSLCVIAQGSKEVLLGDNRYRYDPTQYLIATAALPIATRVVEASEARPYLALVLDLDPTLVGSVMVEAGHVPSRSQSAVTALDVSPLDAGLLDATVRLIRLLDTPTQARFLAPLITREIIYRLLIGAQGARLSQVAAPGGSTHRITEAIEWLRSDFKEPLSIENIARTLGMSVSGFHHHFRLLTAMSPLQYQKHLRLQEARRLMLGEGLDAASAGYRVGYGDASHFTREYKRLFGAPPMRDMEQMREGASTSTRYEVVRGQ